MLRKIISGGQTGADQAALDTAIKFNIKHGGWIPKGRLTENGPLLSIYQLDEMSSSEYPKRTKQNIIDSDGTLIVSRGLLTGGSLLTKKLAADFDKPFCHIDLLQTEEFESALLLNSFMEDNNIEVLNVAGPRLSSSPGIYQDVRTILETFLYLKFLDNNEKDFKEAGLDKLESFDEKFLKNIGPAVEILKKDLTLKQKIFIARIKSNQIGDLYFSMVDYVRAKFGFNSQNPDLFKQCSKLVVHEFVTIEDSVMVVIKALKQSLDKEFSLKVLK